MVFIDYEKAFDIVESSAAVKALRKQGVKEIYVKIIEDIYKESTVTIKLYKISIRIPIQKGVRQGKTTFLKLLTTVLEEVFKSLEWEK